MRVAPTLQALYPTSREPCVCSLHGQQSDWLVARLRRSSQAPHLSLCPALTARPDNCADEIMAHRRYALVSNTTQQPLSWAGSPAAPHQRATRGNRAAFGERLAP